MQARTLMRASRSMVARSPEVEVEEELAVAARSEAAEAQAALEEARSEEAEERAALAVLVEARVALVADLLRLPPGRGATPTRVCSRPSLAMVTLRSSMSALTRAAFSPISWSRASIGGGGGYCFSVWGYSPADVFIGCSFGDWFRSPQFTVHTAPGADDIRAIHGLSDGGSIYAVGSNWSLLRFESGDFVKVDAGVELSSTGARYGFRTVAVAAEHDIWLGGAEGTIVRGDGTTWAVVDAGVSDDVYRIWANGPDDVWFVGLSAIVLHWNGMSLERPTFCSTCGAIYTAWGHSAGDMWFGDGNGGLRHWDGVTLGHSISPPGVLRVVGVYGVGEHDLFATGALTDGNWGLIHFQL